MSRIDTQVDRGGPPNQPPTRTAAGAGDGPSRREIADRLRQEAVGVRLERSQFGVTRKLTAEQRDQIAQMFDAESARLSAGKKLLNKRHEAYLRVTSLLNRAKEVWMDTTLPYPDPGIRLIRRDRIPDFDGRMRAIRTELREAAVALERVYRDELIPDARRTLGAVFNPSDYPVEIAGEFDIQVSYPNVEPGEYLREISPRLYEQEQERIRARFEEAIALAEQAFTDEFAKAVQHMAERLTPGPDGKAKVFQETTLGNLTEFFQRFRDLNVGSNAALDDLVTQAQWAVQGIDVKALRNDVHAREAIRSAMQNLGTQLDGLMVDRPKRKITLEDETTEEASPQTQEPNAA